ncbi:MAG: exodeoxyribonuclease VII large subunit [Bacteroidia bacterium]|jgi:exodeoxyribonuclease VII large subunit
MELEKQTGLRLSEFATKLQQGIRSVFGGQIYNVIGEISNIKVYEGRRQMYFHLVEKSAEKGDVIAELSCFGFDAAFLSVQRFETETGQKLIDGIEVLMAVRVEFHATRGLKLQLVSIDPSYTVGMLRKQRQLNIERLLRENKDAAWTEGEVLVTRNQRLPLPLAIRRIAVLSSEQSAGYQDFMHTLEENLQAYQFDIQLYPVLVQGEGNADALVKRLVEIYESGLRFDVVVLVRGGGSQTDLLLFDAYQLVRAIARFPIPILTGLGHLKDVSLADLVAHSGLKTPTKVAEFIIDHNAAFEQSVIDLRQRLVLKVQQNLIRDSKKLASNENWIRSNLDSLLSKKKRETDTLLFSLRLNTSKQIASAKHAQLTIFEKIKTVPAHKVFQLSERLKNIESLAKAYGPDAILKRGFAYIEKEGKIIKRTAELESNDVIQIVMADGKAQAAIQNQS